MLDAAINTVSAMLNLCKRSISPPERAARAAVSANGTGGFTSQTSTYGTPPWRTYQPVCWKNSGSILPVCRIAGEGHAVRWNPTKPMVNRAATIGPRTAIQLQRISVRERMDILLLVAFMVPFYPVLLYVPSMFDSQAFECGSVSSGFSRLFFSLPDCQGCRCTDLCAECSGFRLSLWSCGRDCLSATLES